jgi:hypothetical protein
VNETPDGRGGKRIAGYGVDSIVDFVSNVAALTDGAGVDELKGTFADGRDALEATRVAAAVHESVEKGSLVEITDQ